MEPLNNIDVVILIVVALSMMVAFIRGFVKEILSIIGLALFVIITVFSSPTITSWVETFIASKLMAQFVTFLVIMAVFYAFWIVGTDKIIANIRKSTLSFMDRLFGLIFGFLRAVLILGFCFLVVKIVLPEELKTSPLKDAKFFMMAEPCADVIEKLLPDDFVKNTIKSVEELNKVKKNEKTSTKDKKKDVSGLPSKLDQKQMDEMFELLVNPHVKNNKKSEKEADEKKGYDKKETSSLDKLIDVTVNE